MVTLIPELQQRVFQHPELGEYISHPLVHMVGYVDYELANRQYESKSLALDKALESKSWSSYIYLHERPYRLDALLDIADEMSDKEYWEKLSDVWMDSENIWQNIHDWIAAWNQRTTSRELVMTKQEREEFDAMPEQITVYRGALSDKNKHGMSWTIYKDKAEWFSTRFAGDGDIPVVIERVVNKSEILAYFTRRGENEVVLDISQ
jgi:hypothetical protein